jgi:NAD(P)-dependent dehydrogenase (short-subunit alcohol dehydrogenase family)
VPFFRGVQSEGSCATAGRRLARYVLPRMSSTSPHAGRVAIITGAGAGVGRGYALRLAMQGARVVVNDVGGKRKGANQEKRIASNADAVVEEIHSLGGEAVADYEDVADWAGAQRLIQHALDAFGDLHVLICNAGILRDRTLINLSESDWDDVMRVHLKGSFAPAKHAAEYWRDKAKEQSPEAVNGRVILTSSVVGLFGNYGQTNYGGAKAALANIGTTLAAELDRYGVTVNTICPSGLTRMTEDLRPDFGSEELGEGNIC